MTESSNVINFIDDDDNDNSDYVLTQNNTNMKHIDKKESKGFGFTNYSKEKLLKTANKLLRSRKSLPIFSVQSQLKSVIDRNDNIVIVGATGSGKTTQIPQFLYKWGYCKNKYQRIAITQPRRVAATSIAQRVSNEFGCNCGDKIGYHVRFDKTISSNTQIVYLTDGMLLRECMMDAMLDRYSIIILDEAHERTLNTDVLFGLIKSIQSKRNKNKKKRLKVIIMSATLQSDKMSAYFNNAAIFNVCGRMFDVETLYITKPEINYLDATLTAILQTHLEAPDGDILAFLTGKDEIDSMCDMLQSKGAMIDTNKHNKLHILPLYSSLPPHLQHLVFKATPKGFRKVVICTNIAETSITIPRIKYVIDCGKVKRRIFNPLTGIDVFEIEDISKEESWQRRGRAGRTSSGYCLRLYTETHFEHNMKDHIKPDILRSNLCTIILQLKWIGIDDIVSFDLLDKPENARIVDGIGKLMMMGALDLNEEKLSDLGDKMCIFPLDPIYSKIILSAHYKYKEVLNEILIIISMLSVDGVFFNDKNKNKQFENEYGDHLCLLNMFRCYIANKCSTKWCKQNRLNYKSLNKAYRIYGQLFDLYKMHFGSCSVAIDDNDNKYGSICQCLLEGMFINIAYYDEDSKKYKTYWNNGILVEIHPSSILFDKRPNLLLYSSMVRTKNVIWLKWCTQITNDEWIDDIIPNLKLLKSITIKQKVKEKNNNHNNDNDNDNDHTMNPGRAVKRMHTVFQGIQNGKFNYKSERKKLKPKHSVLMKTLDVNINRNRGNNTNNRNNGNYRNYKNNRNNRNNRNDRNNRNNRNNRNKKKRRNRRYY